MDLTSLVHSDRVNAVLGWTLTAVIGAAAVERLLSGVLLWGALLVVLVVVLAVPAATTGRPTDVVPWPLPFVGAAASLLRTVGVYPDVTGYVVIATLALAIVVELEAYTEVALSRRFAVAFATMTTMALQAVWIVAQFYADRWLGTALLSTQTELQWDLVFVTVVGVALGILAEWYLDRYEPVGALDRPDTG